MIKITFTLFLLILRQKQAHSSNINNLNFNEFEPESDQNNLVCRKSNSLFRKIPIKGDRLGKKPIGCCPPNDPSGKLYGPDKACCCDKVYRPDQQFCCQPTGQCDELTSIMKLEHASQCVPILPEPTCSDTSAFEGPGEIMNCTDNVEIGSVCQIGCEVGFVKINMNSDQDPLYGDDESSSDIYQCSKNALWEVIDLDAQKQECCRPMCPPTYPEDTKADFFIILDKSSSIGIENFEYVKQFMLQIVNTFPLGPNKVQVRLSTYNSIVEHVFELNESANMKLSDIEQRIYNITYSGKGTHTGDGLWDIINHALHEPNNRPDVEDYVLLVTDGRSKQETMIDTAVGYLKNKGVTMMTIGVGDKVRRQELAQMASEPKEDNVRMAKDFAELVDQVEWVLATQCPEYTCE